MIVISFNNFIQNRTIGWEVFLIFKQRDQSVYFRRKSGLLFQIICYLGDIILNIIFNIQYDTI